MRIILRSREGIAYVRSLGEDIGLPFRQYGSAFVVCVDGYYSPSARNVQMDQDLVLFSFSKRAEND
jgi:hypothetical protein